MDIKQVEQQINALKANMMKMQIDYKRAIDLRNKELANTCVRKYWQFRKDYQIKIKLHYSLRKLRKEERLKFTGNSSVPRAIQEEQRHRHAKEIIQPREQGELNPDFIKQYGFKGLRVDSEDVKQLQKKSRKRSDLGSKFEKKVLEEANKQDKELDKQK